MSPVELLPYLYIGDASHSSMKEQLQELHITAILNVSTCCRNHFPQDFRYKVIPVEDSDSADLSTWFADAFHFIGKYYGRFSLSLCQSVCLFLPPPSLSPSLPLSLSVETVLCARRY